MAQILVLQESAWRCERIRAAIDLERARGAVHVTRWARDWSDLFRQAAAERPSLAIIDPYAGGPFRTDAVERFLRRFTPVSVIAYGTLERRPAREIVELFRVGVRDVITHRLDDGPLHIRDAIIRDLNAGAVGEVLQAIERLTDAVPNGPAVSKIMRTAFELAVRPQSPEALAQAVGWSRRTLERFLHDAHLPPPEQLIGAMRLLQAVRLLQDRHRTVASVAASLEVASPSALTKSLRRHAGVGPRDLRTGSISALTIRLFGGGAPNWRGEAHFGGLRFCSRRAPGPIMEKAPWEARHEAIRGRPAASGAVASTDAADSCHCVWRLDVSVMPQSASSDACVFRRLARAEVVALAALATLGASPPAPAQQLRSVVTLESSRSCARCRIDLRPETVLGAGAESAGGVEWSSYVVRDSRGRYYVNTPYAEATVLVFDAGGRFMRTLGRPGQGPGEFGYVNRFLVGADDTLHVFDYRMRRWSVIDPEGRHVRTTPTEVAVLSAVEMVPGRLIINGDLRSRQRVGYPLHQLRSTGLGRSFGGLEGLDPAAGRPQGGQMFRQLVRASDTTFWAAHRSSYVMELWTEGGSLSQRITRKAPWFEVARWETLEGRNNPFIQDVQLDESGIVWVLARVRSAKSCEGCSMGAGRDSGRPRRSNVDGALLGSVRLGG